jgi:hypothetical protein
MLLRVGTTLARAPHWCASTARPLGCCTEPLRATAQALHGRPQTASTEPLKLRIPEIRIGGPTHLTIRILEAARTLRDEVLQWDGGGHHTGARAPHDRFAGALSPCEPPHKRCMGDRPTDVFRSDSEGRLFAEVAFSVSPRAPPPTSTLDPDAPRPQATLGMGLRSIPDPAPPLSPLRENLSSEEGDTSEQPWLARNNDRKANSLPLLVSS